VESAHDIRYSDLLAEPLTDDEVRDLLERLGSKEFGGSDQATVGAVVEATGADVQTVGSLLAQIRKEDFQERFGLRLEEHEVRIDSLETKVRRPLPHVRSEPQLDLYQERALERLANEERQREALRPIAAVCACVAALILLVAVGGQCDSRRDAGPYWESSYAVSDGMVHLNHRGESWVELKSGGRRPATNEEVAPLYLLQAQRSR
jgi:hypothetical protein